MNMTSHERFHTAPAVTPEKMQDRVKENPLESLELDDLDRHVKELFNRVFDGKDSVTEEELIVGARLARSSKHSSHFAQSSVSALILYRQTTQTTNEIPAKNLTESTPNPSRLRSIQ
jgi:hypothetical protein